MQRWYNQNMAALLATRCKMKKRYLCALFILSSCSPAPDNSKSTSPTTDKPAYEVYTVEIKDMKFVPDSITVKKGDEVVFVNRDMVTHCVTEEKNKAWTSGVLPSGQSYLLVVKEPADYFCAIHQVMKGKILVK
jgi:plastocyanin